VLPRNARLTSPSDFARTTKSGIKVTSENFVGYLYIQAATNSAPRAGLIVGKSAGGSVQRHRISRQLRHAIAPTLKSLPTGSLLVIRALKGAASSNISEEINAVITRLNKKTEKFSATGEVKK
jgi:ribonuclease P protein component